jgi:hypothetical protein
MKTRQGLRALGTIGFLLLVGCGDPIVGDWEAEEESFGCGTDDFSVEDDLTGKGTLHVVNTEGACLACDFDLELENTGDGQYEGTVEMEECSCNGDDKFDVECDIADDGESLDCKITGSDCFPEEEMEFDKDN